MMSNDKNPHGIADDTKQKVIRETQEVDAAKVRLSDGKRLRPLRRVQH